MGTIAPLPHRGQRVDSWALTVVRNTPIPSSVYRGKGRPRVRNCSPADSRGTHLVRARREFAAKAIRRLMGFSRYCGPRSNPSPRGVTVQALAQAGERARRGRSSEPWRRSDGLATRVRTAGTWTPIELAENLWCKVVKFRSIRTSWGLRSRGVQPGPGGMRAEDALTGDHALLVRWPAVGVRGHSALQCGAGREVPRETAGC